MDPFNDYDFYYYDNYDITNNSTDIIYFKLTKNETKIFIIFFIFIYFFFLIIFIHYKPLFRFLKIYYQKNKIKKKYDNIQII